MEELIKKLKLNNADCKEILINFSEIEFKSDEESMSLVCSDADGNVKTYCFKINPQDSRNPKSIFAQKQFCSIIKVPHTFFMDCRPSLKDRMFKSFKYSLESKNEKKPFKIKVRESDVFNTIRAIVPINHVCLDNYEILQIIKDSVKTSINIFSCEGMEKDDLIFHVKILTDEHFEINEEKFYLGFSLTSSEVGFLGLEMNVFVYHPESETFYTVTFGTGSYFSLIGNSMQKSDLKNFLGNVLNRAVSLGPEVKAQMQEKLPFLGVKEACRMVSQDRKVPPRVKRELYQEASENGSKMTSNWGFARTLSGMSKKLEIVKRMTLERTAGAFLGLNLTSKGDLLINDEDDSGRETKQEFSEGI